MYDDMMITTKCSEGIKAEALLRLDILIRQGLSEHLDVKSLMSMRNKLCVSKREDVFGEPIGLVVPADKALNIDHFAAVKEASSQNNCCPYFFLIGDIDGNIFNLFSLFISSDENKWEVERELLNRKQPSAILCDTSHNSTAIVNVDYSIFHGGPIITKVKPSV